MPGSTRYHAPPVSYPAGRCLLEAWALLGLCLLLLGALAAAAGQGADPLVHAAAARFLALGVAGWGLVAAWAAWVWRRSPKGQLLWREGQWHWLPEHQEKGQGGAETLPVAALHLALDGQSVLLLRLDGARPLPRWLWLERRRDVARWDDLRRAVWAAQRLPGTSA
jgi:hypothetical protein